LRLGTASKPAALRAGQRRRMIDFSRAPHPRARHGAPGGGEKKPRSFSGRAGVVGGAVGGISIRPKILGAFAGQTRPQPGDRRQLPGPRDRRRGGIGAVRTKKIPRPFSAEKKNAALGIVMIWGGGTWCRAGAGHARFSWLKARGSTRAKRGRAGPERSVSLRVGKARGNVWPGPTSVG